ncbi:MAG: hypothetical protein IIC33_07470 [Chloroflexi bacterium]|nr:hypothetical protein [Chloroflexota bacterium]
MYLDTGEGRLDQATFWDAKQMRYQKLRGRRNGWAPDMTLYPAGSPDHVLLNPEYIYAVGAADRIDLHLKQLG